MDEAENTNNNMSSAPKTATTIGSSMIPVIYKLHDILASSGTELSGISVPQVAVVGSLSSGKSSVLEALVGRDFLPRGCDICTRRPLVLMLENCHPSSDDDRIEGVSFATYPAAAFMISPKFVEKFSLILWTGALMPVVCSFLLGMVVPLKLGYVGLVNRCQEDINKNRSIQEALAYEEQFFHDHPILEQHNRKNLPRLKAVLNSRMHVAMKELQTYGDVVESKAEQGVTLLHILGRYWMEMPTKELFGGARIHYLLQSMFVKLLEEVDPCEKLADEDIAYALRNSSVLVRRQIAQLSDPCHQCLWIVYDKLIKISQACESTGLQRFPSLRRHINEVVRKFLDAAAKPAETMIRNLVEMEESGY